MSERHAEAAGTRQRRQGRWPAMSVCGMSDDGRFGGMSREQGAGSREAGSREQGGRREEEGGRGRGGGGGEEEGGQAASFALPRPSCLGVPLRHESARPGAGLGAGPGAAQVPGQRPRPRCLVPAASACRSDMRAHALARDLAPDLARPRFPASGLVCAASSQLPRRAAPT